MKDTKAINQYLDTCGLLCPEPVMMLHQAVRELNSGQVLEVTATDPSTTRDIPKFCQFLGHELLLQVVDAEVYRYQIKIGV
jgi:tRNA 2-thiouridine synthesizing protein A|tara:strand:+ start:1255 stop:1497 length:243 start_codon:yes stop_codon:yes gene_type:complete